MNTLPVSPLQAADRNGDKRHEQTRHLLTQTQLNLQQRSYKTSMCI